MLIGMEVKDDNCGQGWTFEPLESLKQFPAVMAMMVPGAGDMKIDTVGDVESSCR